MTPPLAFITGASSGIGQALAGRYASDGWRLLLVARRVADIERWRDARGFDPQRVVAREADVSQPQAVADVAAECLAHYGLPDVVIANAGVSLGIDCGEFEDLDVLRRSWETNVLGMAATFQPFVHPMCRLRSGTLVGVASVAGIRGLPGHAAYCSSKAAAISYCESLRGECRPFGVKVVTLLPGYVDTPLTRQNRYPMPFLMSADAFAERAQRAIAAGRRRAVVPWPMSVVARLLHVMPGALFDRVIAGQPRKHRATAPRDG